MLNQQTCYPALFEIFRMAKGLEERSANTQHAELSPWRFVGLLVQDEKMYPWYLRLQRLLKKAKLRQEAALEDIDYRVSRDLASR